MKNYTNHLNDFLINKFLSLGLHIGNTRTFWKPENKIFLKGVRYKFCILDPTFTFLYFRRAIKYLLKVVRSNKKILFLGAPFGLEREFSLLCSKSNHFLLEKDTQGFFTNYNSIYSLNDNLPKMNYSPSLIFVFSPSKNPLSIKEASKLNIPIMAFVSSDDNLLNIDFPIPANVKSQKGSFFLYNFFFHLFKIQSF